MYLDFNLVSQVFPDSLGMKDSDFYFQTISTSRNKEQKRGLFIPLWNNADELMEAIRNGAVGAVWDAGREVPFAVPTLFPIFLTNNMWEDVRKLLILYITIVKQEKEVNQMSKFIDEDLLIERLQTHDNSDHLKLLLQLVQNLEELRRG